MESDQVQSGLRNVIRLAGVGLMIAFLYFGREILIPLALATLLCIVLSPVAGFLERKLRIGRVISVLLVVCLLFALIGGSTWLVGSQAARLVADLPKYRATLVTKVRGLSDTIRSTFGKASDAVEGIKKEASKAVKNDASTNDADDGETKTAGAGDQTNSSNEQTGDASESESPSAQEPVRVEVVSTQYDFVASIGAFLGPVFHPVATVFASILLFVFFLLNRDELRDRLIRLCGRARTPVTTAALDDCVRRVKRFVLAQAVANGVIGLFIGIGLYFLGLPNAALWGLIAAISRFLPYIGTFLAAALPFALAVAQFDGWMIPVLVISWCVFVDVMSANILEPWLYGSRTGLAPTAILLAFMFWVWLWGGFGLFLATPITVCLVVMGKHIPAFESIYILLSDEPVLEPAARFYQRLLSRNSAKAIEVAEEYAKENNRVQMLDQVVLPGLAKIESDHRVGVIDDERKEIALKTATEILEGKPDDESKEVVASTKGLLIAVVPGDGSFDTLLVGAIREAGRIREVNFKVELVQGLTSEVIARVKLLKPSVVVLGSIEPRSIGRLQYIFRRLRTECRGSHIELLTYAGSRTGVGMIRRLSMDITSKHDQTLAKLIEEIKGYRPTTGAALEPITLDPGRLDSTVLQT